MVCAPGRGGLYLSVVVEQCSEAQDSAPQTAAGKKMPVESFLLHTLLVW